jgi:hypothetical protein
MKSLRSAVYAVVIVFLSACASTADPKISLGSTEYGFHNAGLVVGRTLAHTEPLIGARGLALDFRNEASGVQFSTSGGISGYTKSEYFAIWLPAGTYTVSSVFVYNGGVGPADEPFMFVVKPGVMIYIGTIVNSWEMPKKGVEGLGRVLAVKRHGRLNCPLFGSCDAKSQGLPANAYVKGPPYADVAVFDEGPSFAQGLKAAIPDLPNVPMERWFMW